jgi:hypothetical protein
LTERRTQALSLADDLVGLAESGAVSYTVANVDDEASVVVTFTDGEGSSVAGALAGNVTGTVNLSSLADVIITSSLVITDAAENTAEVTGDSTTLDQTNPATPATPTIESNPINGVDVTSDSINASEVAAGIYLKGSGEANATVTVTFDNATTLENGNTVTVNQIGEWHIPITSSDVINMGEGDQSITVFQTDEAGNLSSNSDTLSFNIDTTNLAASFEIDDTATNNDGITNNITVDVDLADDVDSWEYSLDSGGSYTAGSINQNFGIASDSPPPPMDSRTGQFQLGANTTYAIGAVVVRQTDDAGNVSATVSNTAAITTDTIAPTVSSVVIADDALTYDQTVAVTVNFDGDITTDITSASTLSLDIGGTSKLATYASNTDDSITFNYDVESGLTDVDGVTATADGITLNNGETITDEAGNTAAITYVAVTNSDTTVDGTTIETSAVSLDLSSFAAQTGLAAIDATNVIDTAITITADDIFSANDATGNLIFAVTGNGSDTLDLTTGTENWVTSDDRATYTSTGNFDGVAVNETYTINTTGVVVENTIGEP